MDEKKKDHGKKKRPSWDAPSFMQPKKPVLDEPLTAGEEGEKVEALAESSESGQAQDVVEIVENVEEVQEVERVDVIPVEAGSQGSEESEPYSPYFPNGVYEDAQAVEAFYGRGKPKEGE